MSDQSNGPTSSPAGTGGPADAPGKSSGGDAKAAGLGIAGDAAKAKAGGATNSEVVSGAAKQGVQKVAEAGVKKATGSDIAVDALRSAQKVKGGDVVGGAQNLAASGANAATTAAVGATGVGAPVATLAGSAVGSVVNSKLGRVIVGGIIVGSLVAGGAVIGGSTLLVAGTVGAISAVIGEDVTSSSSDGTCSSGSGSGSGGAISLTGTGIEQRTWNFFREAGYTEEQTAGIMGSIKRESQFNPFIAEGVTGTPNTSRGWGLVQWTADRHVAIKTAVIQEFTSEMYVASPSESEMPAGISEAQVDEMILFQLNYILMELNGPEKAADNILRKKTTVADAAIAFDEHYERSGVPAISERIANAEAYYEKFSGSGGDSAPAPDVDAPAPAAPAPAADSGIDTSKLESPVSGYDGESMKRALEIYQTVESAGGPDEASVLAITAAMGESGLGMNDDIMSTPDDEGKQGLYRMVVEKGHDPFVGESALDTKKATLAWYNGVAGKDGLKDVKGWEGMAPELAIQQVQGNADSDNYVYRDNYSDAKEIFGYVSKLDTASLSSGSVTDSSACGSSDGGSLITGDNSGPVNAALSLLPGKYPYVFGGGNGDGPTGSNIEGKDAGEIGYDCSGVTSYAYKQGAGIDLPRTARAQWAAYKSNAVVAEDIQPGDLIFYAYGRLGSEISHVAIYIGDGQMIEASRGANLVKQTPARISGSGFVGIARVLDGTESEDNGGAGDTVGDARLE